MVSSKVCEDSLRWVLNLRNLIITNPNILKANPIELVKNNNLTADLAKLAKNDGHSYYSLNWTLTQAIKIDKIGLDKWLKTNSAKGFGPVIGKIFEGKLDRRLIDRLIFGK